MSERSVIDLSQEQCDVVKHVLFGNQRQSNVTNEAVVKLVAREIVLYNPDCHLKYPTTTALAIKGLLEEWVSTQYGATRDLDEVFVMLVAGEESLAALRADGPKVVSVTQPSPDSPKYNFRIQMLGDAPDVDMSATVGEAPAVENPVSSSGYTMENHDVDPDDIVTQTAILKDKILQVAPPAVLSEFNDDYAAALYMYPTYTKMNM